MNIEVIRLILELHFAGCVWSEKNLTRRVDTPAVELVSLENIGRVEVAHAAAAPVDCVFLARSAMKRLKFYIQA